MDILLQKQGLIRAYIKMEGIVQGIGFRPFILRLASELDLTGFVSNTPEGVDIEVQGSKELVNDFVDRIVKECPKMGMIDLWDITPLQTKKEEDFRIVDSRLSGVSTAGLPADLAMCDECKREVFDPQNRRYRYPFINCVACGPRYSIIERIPYDRGHTTMNKFLMCEECRNEFKDPLNRRFHAQPNACPVCGPQCALWDKEGNVIAARDEAVRQTAGKIKAGQIVAFKGLGGFQLMVDACDEGAVERLRRFKKREEKPFAVMFSSIDAVRAICICSEYEESWLTSVQAPIVLLRRKENAARDLASGIAPDNPLLGVMLPYTGLHHLLMNEMGRPIVATSGNLSDEPMCIDENEALQRIQDIADFFLVHNRPIARHMDDSILRVIGHKPCILRRARGFAPLPITVNEGTVDLIATGAFLKNTVAIKIKRRIFLSQHIGDLRTPQAIEAFDESLQSLRGIYPSEIRNYACDLHPDYFSSEFARKHSHNVFPIQHHHAHISACMAEHGLTNQVFGIAWDGTGLGDDQTIWGGEFMICTPQEYKRFGHFRYFKIPGGDQAMREPYKAAFGLLSEAFGCDNPVLNEFFGGYPPQDRKIWERMIRKDINSPWTSSVGRLFDAVSYLAGLGDHCAFEGQAAMKLEFAVDEGSGGEAYSFRIIEDTRTGQRICVVDWQLALEEMLNDIRRKMAPGKLAAKFHHTLVEIAVRMAVRAGQKDVVLSGGCFQNQYLTERIIERLEGEGLRPYWHNRVPPNDGGIALGQAYSVACRLAQERVELLNQK